MKLKPIAALTLLTMTCILVSSGYQQNETYSGHNLSFAIPEGWDVVKDVQDGNDTQIVLSDNISAIRIDLVKSSDQELNRLMLEHLNEKKALPSSEIDLAANGLWKLIYYLVPWDANGAIGSYYKDKVIETRASFCSSGSGISIKPDRVEQASVYFGCEEPPSNWLMAWTKPEYNEEFIGVHALFLGEYEEIPFEWQGAPHNYTMQQPLHVVLSTITRGDVTPPWEMV
ncbi:MAG TPA: hypothetical protein PLN41_06715 [Methanothrix sp.]|nr:hypothetical protein [Methanothrix sp.]HOI69418.1 hypothetical protein [Methanothrix sp.]